MGKKIIGERQKKKLFKKVQKMQAAGQKGSAMERGKNRVNIGTFIKIGIPLIALMIVSLFLVFIAQDPNKIAINKAEIARSMTYNQVQPGEEVSNVEYVHFDAFFLRDLDGDGYTEKLRGTCREIGETDNIYMELNVLTKGYLKDGVITINGNNFSLSTAIVKDAQIKNNYIGNDITRIELNQINNGTQKLLIGKVNSKIGKNIYNYSKINSIVLTGTHVEELIDGTTIETPVEKVVNFQIDWHKQTSTKITNLSQTGYIDNIVDEDNNTVNLNFSVSTQENIKKLLLKKASIEATLPQLNGYDPTSVEVTNGATYTYNSATRELKAEKEADVNEEGTITNSISNYNTFHVKVSYPLEAYRTLGTETFQISIPIKAKYEGFNNPNPEFMNPYVSSDIKTITLNYLIRQAQITQADFRIYVGKHIGSIYGYDTNYMISKQKPINIYFGRTDKETDDIYNVTWQVVTGTNGETSGVIMKETPNNEQQVSDKFIKSDLTKISMEELTTNIGISFSNPELMLGENGWIKVYDDETDNLIVTFTKENWNTKYMYEMPVKHVRVETSGTKEETSLSVYHTKELDDEYITSNYTIEEFENLKYIQSSLSGTLGNVLSKNISNKAAYIAELSRADLSLNKTAISTQETEKNVILKINTNTSEYYNYAKWLNGSFLLKMPKDILSLDINSVTINNNQVNITSYEKYEMDGNIFIKINTENEEETSYEIQINCNLTPDPRISTRTETVELYAYNEYSPYPYKPVEDVYDVNDDFNITEKVHNTAKDISLISPNALLTNQIASEYDQTGAVTIAPKTAFVSKEQRSAKINIEVMNNYSNTISELVILGKIPTTNSRYILNGTELGSQFDTSMQNTGIILPVALQEIATVYYSEQVNPNNDLSDTSNGWTTEPTDFGRIKSFLIDLGNYVLAKGEKQQFSYIINIPSGIDYNKISYSHHAVFFCLDTEEGKYRTQTEPNKLGLMISKKYNLNVTKYQKGTNKKVSGATYSITEQETDECRTKVTSNGVFALENLLAEKVYIIKEIKTPEDYELNEDEIVFTAVEEAGDLKIEVTSGTTRKAEIINIDNNSTVNIELEDEAKASLELTKLEKGTTQGIKGVRYKLLGKGFKNSGRIITTNVNGELSVKGLYIGEEYVLEEMMAPKGYYLTDPIKFKIEKNNGAYELNVIEGTIKENEITTVDEIPTLNMVLEDEKIPTYNLEITKVVKGEDTSLEGAKFKLIKEGKENGSYITGIDGKVIIQNLYQYVEGKEVNATYTLQEVLPPDGYAKMKDITFKAQVIDEELKLQVLEGKVKETLVEGTTIKIVLENSPSLKITKKDGTTGELLPNTKFTIFDVTEGRKQAIDSKGNLVGISEEINGKMMQVVTTNANGEITVNLPEGMYEVTEVQASDDKYDIKGQTYYVGIGASREGNRGLNIEWEKTGLGTITSVVKTSDGGYLVGGYQSSSLINKSNGYSMNDYDGILIKYAADMTEEWRKTDLGAVTSVIETSDGYYLVGGYFYGTKDLGNGITITSNGHADGMLIKYESNGNAKWAKNIGGTHTSYSESINSIIETSDGDYVVTGYYIGNKIDLGNGIELTNTASNFWEGMLIKYTSDGETKWARTMGGSSEDWLTTVIETSDYGYIAGGFFQSSNIKLDNVQSLSATASRGILLKYDEDGQNEWNMINLDGHIYSILETQDNGLLIGGSNGIVKYDSSRNIEWSKTGIGTINSVIEISDGGYLVGGSSGIIKYSLEGEEEFRRTDLGTIYSAIEISDRAYLVGGSNGILRIKDKEIPTQDIKWGKTIIGMTANSDDKVFATNDGGYIIKSQITNGLKLNGEIDLKQYTKFDKNGGIIWTSEECLEEYIIESKYETEDGGYLEWDNTTITKYDKDGNIFWKENLTGTSLNIKDIVEIERNNYIVIGSFKNNISFGDKTILTASGSNYKGYVIKLVSEMGAQEQSELLVENQLKEYKITTLVEEIDGEAGGNISGNKQKPYEIVNYGANSEKEIKIVPNEEYEISKITINGEEIAFVKEADGTYTMPVFTNMIEDKHVVVTFVKTSNKLTIIKQDEETNERIPGVEFKIDQIEERTEPTNVIGGIVNNGIAYNNPDLDNEITGVIGELTQNNETYYFIKNEDETLTPNNTGISSSEAKSYIPIDLTSYSGIYQIVVNAKVSSEQNYDIGYVTIKTTVDETNYNDTVGQFAKISGTGTAVTNPKDYISEALEGGQIYYLHFGYRKNGGSNSGDDKLTINSIKVYESTTQTYYFEQTDGKYISNNQGKSNTIARSYIPINLEGLTGKYNLIVNATASSDSNDYGYAIIKDSTELDSLDNAFMKISGTNIVNTDYSTVVNGGQIYYLHFAYSKNGSVDSGDDSLTINSIQVTLNDTELYHKTATTGIDGQAVVQLPIGKYEIKETKPAEGYSELTEPIIYQMMAGEENDLVVNNRKLSKITVHHYKKNTTTKVAEDEYGYDSIGKGYTTSPRMDLNKYELIKDVNGEYVIPENASGTYGLEEQEIIYEYEDRKVNLIVHHYLEGTTTKLADDETTEKEEGQSYTTSQSSEISANYECINETPTNYTGTMGIEDVEVTYYYRLQESTLTNEISKTASANKVVEEVPVLTVEDGEVTYNITYTAVVENHKGNAKFTVIDTLPAKIDEDNSDIKGGVYNDTNKTITWEDTIEVDTFENGEYTYNLSKQISVVYVDQDVTVDLTNEVVGSVVTYYPTNDPIHPGEERQTETATTTSVVHQEYLANKTISKVWDHTNNENGVKPTRIILQIKNGNTVVDQVQVTEDDSWEHTFNNLPKYNSEGVEIVYTAGEAEVELGELSKYRAEINGLAITNIFDGAVIDASKSMQTEKNKPYLIKGERITYIVTVYNQGGQAQDVVIKDIVPTGTSFVENSIKINGSTTNNTEADLISGITVNVPAKTATEYGTVTVSFEVIVNENASGMIKNKATYVVDEDERETNEVQKPVIKISKEAAVTRNTLAELQENGVTATDEITYKIKVQNTASIALAGIVVKDTVPTGTSFVANSIKVNGVEQTEKTEEDLTNGISVDIAANSTTEVSFKVKVEYSNHDGTINNIANVDNNTTNEAENPYKKPVPIIDSNIDKTGDTKIVSSDSNVYYEIQYTATIKDFVGSATVTIVDNLPYEIDETNSVLNSGDYDAENKTITWVQEVTGINTYLANEDKEIAITKAVSLKYNYGNINEISNNVVNTVNGKIDLKENDTIVKTETKEDTKTIPVEIPAKVIVHHYIEGTTTPLANDETKNGIIGQSYTTTKSSSVPSNYGCINETPTDHAGTMRLEDIEVTYYYRLKESTLTSNITKTASANKVVEGIPVLTVEDGEVTYNITYTGTVDEYKGNAKFTVVDTLPERIDETQSNLYGGTYNDTNKTITWDEIVAVDTFTNGKYTYALNKQIKVVFVNQDVTRDLTNEVVGSVAIYYPENDPNHPGEVKQTETDTATSVVHQEYLVNKMVSKVWNDNNNSKGRRPESITITLTADGIDVENKTIELTENDDWEYIFRDLPKYNAQGNEIRYSVRETETNTDDLEYYETPEIDGTNNIVITNSYKLKNTQLDSRITKQTEGVITSSKQEVNYTITYNATITDYIGDASLIVVDKLEYQIDLTKSNIAGGIYNDELKTITWTERIPHINTDRVGEPYAVEFNKEIKVVYKDLDPQLEVVKNKAIGTIELYETEQRNTIETEIEKTIDIKGNLIVKYVDKDTGVEIKDRLEGNEKVGTMYRTFVEEIPNYTFDYSTNNTQGEYKEETTEVIYYYIKTPAQVIVKYVDEAGNELSPEEIINGYVTKPYETSAKELETYNLVKVIGNENGNMTEDTIEVIYVYSRMTGEVIVKYLEKETEKELEVGIKIEGYVGENYETSRKVIEDYKAADPEPTNKTGNIKIDQTEVIYYYEKIPSGKVIVKYIDIDTKEELADEYVIEGKVGDKYKAEEKEIPYYNIVEGLKPIKAEGLLSQEDYTIIFYYRKQEFNLQVNKNIVQILVNDKLQKLSKNGLDKIEVHAKKITSTVIKIKYLVTIKNTGNIEGTAVVVEKIPLGFIVSGGTSSEWKQTVDGNLELEVKLKPGASKEIEVELQWDQDASNFGERKNVVTLKDIKNPANYNETSIEDNTSEVIVLMTVNTGKETSILIVVLGFIAASGSLILGYEYELYKKQRKEAMRVVKIEGKNVVIRKEVLK